MRRGSIVISHGHRSALNSPYPEIMAAEHSESTHDTSLTPHWAIYGVRFTVTLLSLACMVVWHISLLWLYRDNPLILSVWLAVVFVLVLVTSQFSKHVSPASRGILTRQFARLDGTGIVFILFFLVLLLLFHIGFERAASDGRSYFVQVRSLVMDWDLDFTNDETMFGGHGARQYAFGAPLLWSPFFILGHIWLSALNAVALIPDLGGVVRLDGYYFPYQRAIGLGTLFYGFIGLVLIYRILRRYCSQGLASLSTLGLCATSFLIWYLTVDNSMVHGVSMFATSLFLFLWHQHRDTPSHVPWIQLGIAAGVMMMVRWQNIAFAVLPLADLAWSVWCNQTDNYRERVSIISRGLLRFSLAAVIAFSPQLLFWESVYGSFLYLPTQEHAFEPSVIPPYITDVLFSSNRGLLSWTPVITAALIGLVFFARDHTRVALVLAGGFLAQVWINGSVEIWWGGVGFGARRFANCAVIFAVGLAGLLTAIQRRPLIAPTVTLVALLLFNTVFMLGYRNGSLSPTEGVTFNSVTNQLYEFIGNPFSLPVSAYVAWRYDVGLPVYDRLRGRTYNNLSIDIGAPGDERFLGHGWAAREQHPNFSFRWADSHSSTVLIPLKTNADDYLLEIEWGPFSAPELPPQIVSIDVNNIPVTALTLRPGVHVDRITIPSAALRSNLNQIRFRYEYAVAPQDLGISEDQRQLAIQVASVRLQRILRP